MSPATEPLILPLSSGALVFGMDWFPLMGGRPDRVGPGLARRHRSTHLVLPDTALGAVGVAALKRPPARQNGGLYSAAQNLAQIFPNGSVAVLLELRQFGHWLVAVHEGVVVARTDRIYRSPGDAAGVIDGLRQAYPQLRVLDHPQAEGLPTLAAIEAASSPRSRLQPLRRWRSVLPWPVQCFALALTLALLLPRAWPMLHRDPAGGGPVAPDPGQAWRQAVAASARGRLVHGPRGTRALLETLHALPVDPGGWSLLQAECLARGGHWQCQAHYERQSREASNRSFLAALQSSWTAEFSSLERAAARWKADAHGMPLSSLVPPSSARNESELLSALQAVLPAFAQLRAGAPTPLPLSVPTDGQGAALARPPGQAVYLSRPVRISGPLRSASLLLPNTASVSWEKAALTLSPAGQPGLRSSKLNLSLQGVFYEIDKAAAGVPDADGGLCGRPAQGGCPGP